MKLSGGNENTAETELFLDGVFETGPEMPSILDRTCAAQISDERVIIAGGYSFEDGTRLE